MSGVMKPKSFPNSEKRELDSLVGLMIVGTPEREIHFHPQRASAEDCVEMLSIGIATA